MCALAALAWWAGRAEPRAGWSAIDRGAGGIGGAGSSSSGVAFVVLNVAPQELEQTRGATQARAPVIVRRGRAQVPSLVARRRRGDGSGMSADSWYWGRFTHLLALDANVWIKSEGVRLRAGAAPRPQGERAKSGSGESES
jgi:hypothetical protein